MEFGLKERLHGSDASLAMIRYQRARCGYVEEDQDGFDGVELESIGEPEVMDNGMESNDGWKMDQEWKQGFSMMEGIKLATQIGKSTLCTVCSKNPSNLTNQSGTVRNALWNCPFKDTTKSYYRLSESYESRKQSRVSKIESNDQTKRQVYQSETEKSRARESGFGCIYSTSCYRPLKDNTQSYYYSSEDEFERVERKEKKRYKRKLIREHLRRESKDKPYEYCLESFEYTGQNLAYTDETDGGITVSDWREPDTNEDNESDKDEIFVGYFESDDDTIDIAENLIAKEMWTNVEH